MALRTYPAHAEFEALRKNIGPLKDAFDLLDDHVVITDPNGAILYANKAVERNTGYILEEILGKNPGDLWGGACRGIFMSTCGMRSKLRKSHL